MPEFIYHFSSVPLFAFLCITLVLVSTLVISLAYRFVPLHFRYQENTAIVSCSAFLGVTYAILIGFTILYELNAFDKADAAASQEGHAVYTIFRYAKDLPEPAATKIRTLVTAYAKTAIDKEWVAMNKGRPADLIGKELIEEIINVVNTIKASSSTVDNSLNTVAVATNMLFELHHERVSKVHSTLNGHIWFVLLLTTFLTLGINCLLGMDYLLHIICLAFMSVMIATIMYLVIGLDRPYQGDFVVRPESLSATLEYINLVKQVR
jgi:hypothetical protein